MPPAPVAPQIQFVDVPKPTGKAPSAHTVIHGKTFLPQQQILLFSPDEWEEFIREYLKAHPGKLESLPLGTFAVTTTPETGIPAGIVFCLRAEGEAAVKSFEPGYPLAPHYLVHVGDDGAVLLPFTQAKTALDRLKRICVGRDLPDAEAYDRFEKTTKQGEDMVHARKLLSATVASIIGKKEERAVESLFTPGGTHAMKGEFAGINDFEVVAYLVVLPNQIE
jgi:hypothetical protein